MARPQDARKVEAPVEVLWIVPSRVLRGEEVDALAAQLDLEGLDRGQDLPLHLRPRPPPKEAAKRKMYLKSKILPSANDYLPDALSN